MTTQPPLPDPRNVWQEQRTEGLHMSVEQMREKAQSFLSKSRRDNIVWGLFTAVAVIFTAFVAIRAQRTPARIIAALAMTMLLAGLCRSLYFSYRRSGTHVALTTCLEAYRRELERQQFMRKQPAWHVAAALFIVGWLLRDAVLRSSHTALSILIPLVLLAAGSLLLLLLVRKWQGRQIQQEIDALDRFEENNP